MKTKVLFPLSFCLILMACASNKPVMTGHARPAVPVETVKVYPSLPSTYEDVATVYASNSSLFTPGGPKQIDKVVLELKQQAAQLGANGIVLMGFADAQTGSLGTGVGSQSYSRSSTVGLGVGGSFGVFKKTGSARAIFVAPE